MPQLFGAAVLDRAIATEALPALDVLAANPNYLEGARRRFHDDPPPYHSSTEEEDNVPPPMYQKIPDGSGLPEEITDIIDEPLDPVALENFAHMSLSSYEPGSRFKIEAGIEETRINKFFSALGLDDEITKWLNAPEGWWRRRILARHFVKKRWQKLGVWNPRWGIPARFEPQARDSPELWRWKWDDGSPPRPDWRGEAAPRMAFLRRGLRRGEQGPLPPRSSIDENTSASQAESFITSRPWFTFRLDCKEEMVRETMLPRHLLQKYSTRAEVIRRWKERGDWRETVPRVGWKWRHESPSPEPEDLTQYNTIDDLELTPSEVDAMDAIPPPKPAWVPTYMPPTEPFPPSSLFGPRLPRSPSPADESVANPAGVRSASQNPAPSRLSHPPLPPPQRQPSRPHPSPPGSAGEGPLPEKPPLRRSARIAARRAAQEAQTSKVMVTEEEPQLRSRAGRMSRTRTRASAAKSGGRQRADRSSTTTRAAAAAPQGVAKRRRRRKL